MMPTTGWVEAFERSFSLKQNTTKKRFARRLFHGAWRIGKTTGPNGPRVSQSQGANL